MKRLQTAFIKSFALAALLVAFAAVGTATADIVEIGDTGSFPTAACPLVDTCQAIGRVTGYQIQVGETRNLFKVQQNGHIFALKLSLPAPTAKQLKFFNDTFGGPPRIRVAILRPKPLKGVKYRYVLAAQSDPIDLTDYLGSTPVFPLSRTLGVRPGDIVGLTAETWIPAFAVALDATNAWRASRSEKQCKDVSNAAMHNVRGEIVRYGCLYRTARLLYSASMLTDPVPTGPTAPTTKK